MKRSEFLALALSPLLAPFVKGEEPRYKWFYFHNTEKQELRWSAIEDPFTHTHSFTISEAEAKAWSNGSEAVRDAIIRRHRGF